MQALIGKTGKESLKRRVSEFDVDKLQLSVASKAKELLKNYNMNEIRDTSHGAATFYVWVRILLLHRSCHLLKQLDSWDEFEIFFIMLTEPRPSVL